MTCDGLFEIEDCPQVYKNVTNDLALLRVLIAQWIQHPPGVRKVVGSNPVIGSEFFMSIVGLKKRHYTAVINYFFISIKPLPKLVIIY